MKKYILLILIVLTTKISNSQIKFNITSIRPGKKLEFNLGSMVQACKDPHKLKLIFISGNKVIVSSWYKGCPNNQIREEQLSYDYYIDDANNYIHEYDWLRTDKKVLVLTNNEAGYYNGYYNLAKKYIISNAYNSGFFLDGRIFEQLDLDQYPSRNGVYTNAGALVRIY